MHVMVHEHLFHSCTAASTQYTPNWHFLHACISLACTLLPSPFSL